MTSALRTIVVGGDAESTSLLKGLLAATSAVVVAGEFKRLAQALHDGPARRPDLVIVELAADEATGPDGPPAKVVEALARGFPDATVFATGSSVSADFVIQAIRAGAAEFLRRPVQRDDLSAALEKLLRPRRGSQRPARAGRITSVFSPKGGLGVTTLATNLAVCLAERSSGSTILIDLDTRQSDIATFLNLRQTYSVLDALESLERLDESLLHGLLIKHASGLFVLPGPTRIERSQISAEQVQAALEIIRSYFDHVVLDLRHDFDPGTIAALEASDTILYLTSLTVSALRSGSAGLAALRHLGVNPQRVKIVVMRDGTGEDVTLKHAQEALGLPIYWRTPSDYPTVVSSINSGQPVVTAAPRSKIAKNLRELAGGLHRPGSPTRSGAARSLSFMRLAWNPKGIPGDG
ncbi:MAG: AAA family ATPase [Candidatus Rokuibacteriota bacterium]